MVKKLGLSQGIWRTNSCHQRWFDKPNHESRAILSQSVNTAQHISGQLRAPKFGISSLTLFSIAKTLSMMTRVWLAPPMNLYRSAKMYLKSLFPYTNGAHQCITICLFRTQRVNYFMSRARTHDIKLKKLLRGQEKEELYVINLTGLLSLSI